MNQVRPITGSTGHAGDGLRAALSEKPKLIDNELNTVMSDILRSAMPIDILRERVARQNGTLHEWLEGMSRAAEVHIANRSRHACG